jgi:sugar lactone lactonase YvrE
MTEVKSSEQIAELALDCKCILGEGALWLNDSQTLAFVDILGKKFHLWKPGTSQVQAYDVPLAIGTVVERAKGGCVVALADGLYFLNPEAPSDSSEYLTLICKPEPELTPVQHRFNE